MTTSLSEHNKKLEKAILTYLSQEGRMTTHDITVLVRNQSRIDTNSDLVYKRMMRMEAAGMVSRVETELHRWHTWVVTGKGYLAI